MENLKDVPVRAEFGVHKLNKVGIERANEMAVRFSALVNWLEQEGGCSSSPEFTIVKRKLEEACFYAKKSMAMNGINQEIGQGTTKD